MWGCLVLTEARTEPLCAANATVSEIVVAEYCLFTAVLMFLVQLGAGLAGIAMLSHGISYLDDNVDKTSSAALIGKMRHSLRGTGKYRRAQNLGLTDLNTRKHTTDTQINTPTNV
jgi:hypothetical protein